jgi:hypothetical protein
MIEYVVNDFVNEYPVHSLYWIYCVQIRMVKKIIVPFFPMK